MTTDLKVFHIKEGDIHDFNLLNIPLDVINPLIGALRTELSNRLSALAAPSFRQERALQHQRHLDHCRQTGDNPRQQFIDFPIN